VSGGGGVEYFEGTCGEGWFDGIPVRMVVNPYTFTRGDPGNGKDCADSQALLGLVIISLKLLHK